MATACQACKAPMIFVEIVRRSDGAQKRMPLDAEPDPDGRWFINENTDPVTAKYVSEKDADFRKLSAAKLLHKPHHATCPDSDKFGGKKRGPI